MRYFTILRAYMVVALYCTSLHAQDTEVQNKSNDNCELLNEYKCNKDVSILLADNQHITVPVYDMVDNVAFHGEVPILINVKNINGSMRFMYACKTLAFTQKSLAQNTNVVVRAFHVGLNEPVVSGKLSNISNQLKAPSYVAAMTCEIVEFTGDELIIGRKDTTAFNDLKSLIRTPGILLERKRKDTLFIISINWDCCTEAEKRSILASDNGLALLNDLIEAKKKGNKNEVYMYATGMIKVREVAIDSLGFIGDGPDPKNEPFWIGTHNFSRTPRNIDSGKGDDDKYKPKPLIDGVVRVSSNGRFVKGFTDGRPNKYINRASIVFHELYENYQRTHRKLPYERANETGAHKNANLAELIGKKGIYGNDDPGTAYFEPYNNAIKQ